MTFTDKPLTVAAIQMISGNQLADNLQAASDLIAKAAQAGAQVIALPEAFAVFGVDSMRTYANQEEQPHPPIQSFLSDQAKTHGVVLIGGTIPRAVDAVGNPANANKSFAAVHTYCPNGLLIGRYDKAHLFDAGVDDAVGAYQESATYQHGNQLGFLQTPAGNMGVGVCYDLRFPEFFRAMQAKSNNTLTCMALPSAFTQATGEAHWMPLLRARAIENQCAIIAPNQGGDHGQGRQTYGHSCVIDAWGRVLAECSSGEGFALAQVDTGEQTSLRQKMPVFAHRKSW